MLSDMIQSAERRMKSRLSAFKEELRKIRTGRADPSLLEHIIVDYYNSPTPLSQVAMIAVENSRTLTISPWEKSMIPVIEKSIIMSDLGLNPSTSGDLIRVPLPALTEERRRILTRMVRDEAEKARVSIRSLRREVNTHSKSLVKEKEMSEDDERRIQVDIQKLTDEYIKTIDCVTSEKEKALMSV